MPAIDICEPPIIRAFQKDGWQIIKKPHYLRLTTHYIHADMILSRVVNGSAENIIIVEVKCFTDPNDDLQEFYTAVGQYLFYRSALTLQHTILPLYLALPIVALERLSKEPAMVTTLQNADVKLVVVDTDKEEIVSWTP